MGEKNDLISAGLFRSGIIVFLFLLVGCHPWRPAQEDLARDTTVFAPPRMAPDCIALEVAIAELDAAECDSLLSEIELHIDRQELSLAERQQWDKNGLQGGLMAAQLPGRLRAAMETRDMTAAEMAELGLTPVGANAKPLTVSPLIYHRRIQFRFNEPKPIPVSDFYPQATWTVHLDDGRSVGRDEQVRGWMLVESRPGKGSAVDLILTPRITHGVPKRKVTVVDHSFVNQEAQMEIDWTPLSLHATCLPGETVVIFSRSEVGELGDLLLGSESRRTDNPELPARKRVLMLRLIQTQHDDLFVSRDWK